MATLALGAVLALMVPWVSPAHLVPVLAGQLMFALASAVHLVPALTAIRPVATSALAAVLCLAMMEEVGAAWWPAVVNAAWWLAAV